MRHSTGRHLVCLNGEMARILILGGTAWVGNRLGEKFLAEGHEVTCLARGESGTAPSEATFVSVDRRLPGAYHRVSSEHWDEVVELSYDRRLVQGALEALAARATHWTLISSVSVYENNNEPDADESAPLVEPTDVDDYAHAKVTAEQLSRDAVGDRLLIARPGLIAGRGDTSDRFSYWVSRMVYAATDDILAPDPAGRFVQYIDVRDLADWLAHTASRGITGTYNVIGPPLDFAEFLHHAAQVAGFSGDIVTASDDWLRTHGVHYWAGPHSLPLWLPREDIPFAQRSAERFLTSGGTARNLANTLRDVLDDELNRGLSRPRRSGLSREEENALLRERFSCGP